MGLVIEKGVPLPDPRGAYIKDLRGMDLNDSAFIPGLKRPSSISGTLARIRKTDPGLRFTVRPAEGGIRVWRVE